MAVYLIDPGHRRDARPAWPFRLNGASPQARDLLTWLPRAFGGVVDVDLGTRPWPTWLASGLTTVGTRDGLAQGQTGTAGQRLESTGSFQAPSYPFSVSCWFMPFATNQASAILSLSNATSGAGTEQFAIIHSNGSNPAGSGALISAMVRAGSTAFGAIALSPLSVVAYQPYHVAAVFAGTTSRTVYVNGGSAGSNATAQAPSGIDNFTVGRLGDSTPNFEYNGAVWDVRLYGRALAAADIWEMWDPSTRWDLYARPSTRVYFDIGAAPAFNPAWAAHANHLITGVV